jgi:PST family polysaccharide transporter
MSVKKQFISSTFYVAVTKYSSLLIGLLITGILSRLLTPDDFGIVAVVTVLIIFFNLLGDMGISPAIIQNKDLSAADVNAIFSFTILIGSILGAFFFAVAPLVSLFYSQPVLTNICRCFSLSVFFTCANIVPMAMLLKIKQFKYLMYRQLIIQIVAGCVGICAALAGWGVYALVVHAILSQALTFIANWIRTGIKPTSIKMLSLRKIASYSVFQFLFGCINYFARNLDKLLIGKYLSTASLGYYEKSYRLMTLPIDNLTGIFNPAIQPYFSEFQDDKQRIYCAYLKILELLAIVGFPLSAFLHFTAGELVFIIFGNQWAASVPVFQILAFASGFQILLNSTGSVFQSANDTKKLFLAGCISSALLTGAICVGIIGIRSIEGVGQCLLIAFALVFITSFYILIAKTLKQSMLPFFKMLIFPFIITACVFIVEYLFALFFEFENIYISLILKTVAMAIVFLCCCYPRRYYLINLIRH